jgi:16S rRNA G966 N2-methylase RsmD
MDGCAARVAARESGDERVKSLDGFPRMNRLYFGDNLKWLSDRKEFPDASVDLVYLDPPFNSNADYNVLFREPGGQLSQAQFQ